jgi:hypothetical protein
MGQTRSAGFDFAVGAFTTSKTEGHAQESVAKAKVIEMILK